MIQKNISIVKVLIIVLLASGCASQKSRKPSSEDINSQPISASALQNTEFQLRQDLVFTQEDLRESQGTMFYQKNYYRGTQLTQGELEESRGTGYCVIQLRPRFTRSWNGNIANHRASNLRLNSNHGTRRLQVQEVVTQDQGADRREVNIKLQIPNSENWAQIVCGIVRNAYVSEELPVMTIGEMREHLRGILDWIPQSSPGVEEEI